MADNNEEVRIDVDSFDFANEGASEETPMLVNYLITRLQQAMANPALQCEVQQQLQAYGFIPPHQEERIPEKSLGETSKRGTSKVREGENPYKELQNLLLDDAHQSRRRGHAQRQEPSTKEKERSESPDESMEEDVAPRRRRVQRSPTPTKRKRSPHSPPRRESKKEEKDIKKKKERKRSPSSPSSSPSSSSDESGAVEFLEIVTIKFDKELELEEVDRESDLSHDPHNEDEVREDVLEDGGIAKKMLGLVNSTNAALGNVEQALGYARGTFFQQAKSLSYASMMQSFRASVARPQQGPSGYGGPPGHYGIAGHFGPPGYPNAPGAYGPPSQYGYSGQYGLPGHPDAGNPYGAYLQPYGVGSPRPQNLTQWISYGASALGSYLSTSGNLNVSAGTSRECHEGGRLFVPGILYHVKRSSLETNMAAVDNRLTAPVGVNPQAPRQSSEETVSSNTSTGAASLSVRHDVIKGLNPKARFMKIVLSKSLLSDHSLVAYKDGIKDAISRNGDM
ncbi:hypothetical protein L7F22_036400 [Adiantum nelumboides]|nr:hypothetical protein [Adiantum nelumboides]